MKKFLNSKAVWIPFVLVLILGIVQNSRTDAGFFTILTSSFAAAAIAGLVIGGVVYLMFELSGIRRGKK